MAWLSRSLGDSVSSLTGQLSSLTKDILTEGTEEVSDHATELSLAKEKIKQLESVCAAQKAENDRLKRVNRELEEKAESAELQINSISREYRALLEEKEKEVNSLKQRHHELLEHAAKTASYSPGETTPAGHGTDQSKGIDEEFEGWSTEGWGDFDDSLRLQREINHLRQEVTRLRADSQHWRSVAGQLSGDKGVDQSAQHEILDLKAKIKGLEKDAAASREHAQQEVASLQDVYQDKMATLNKRRQEEVTQLKAKLSALEQQLADVRDTDSSSTVHSASVLPESDRTDGDGSFPDLQAQLAGLQQQVEALALENNKVSQAKSHMEGVLQELQTEVETLQAQREEHLVRIAELDTTLRKQSQQHADQVTTLRRQLEELEEEQSRGVQGQEQVGLDLIHAKQCLLEQLDANHESRLKASIVQAGTELQQASSETESLVDQLGDAEQQDLAAGVLDGLERENLVLKEQSLKLQEQVAILEKRAASHQAHWQDSQQTITQLRKQLKGDTGWDTDNTLDQSFTSDNVDSTSIKSPPPATTSPSDDDLSADWQIEREALEDVLAQLRQELRQKDERLSELSAGEDHSGLEMELASLRQEKESLQAQLSSLADRERSLRSEKDELETSIGELDEQHQEATNHLISARNALQAQLADAQQQVKDLQEELQNLSQQNSSSEPGGSPSDTPGAKSPDGLREELVHLQDEVEASRRLAASKDGEIVELKGKLQKGGLAINDLHMDKRELQGQVTKLQDEVKAKVTQIKALREEKAGLVEENHDLAERLQELEDELESWQQRNEDTQLERHKHAVDSGEVDKLHTELAHLQADYATVQETLGTLSDQCEALRTAKGRLQAEIDGLQVTNTALKQEVDQLQAANLTLQDDMDELSSANVSLQGERDSLQGERDSLKAELHQVVEKAVALHRVADLEKQMSGLSIAGSDALTSQHVIELERQAETFREQIVTLTRENAQLQQSVGRHRDQDTSETHDDDESQRASPQGSVAELVAHNRHLISVLQRRSAALDKLCTELETHKSHAEKATDSTQGEVIHDSLGPCISDLKTDTDNLLEAVHQETVALESLQSKHTVSSKPVRLSRLSGCIQEVLVVRAENEHLCLVMKDKDSVIADLRDDLQTVQQENMQLTEAVALATHIQQTLENALAEKESALEMVRAENSQLMGLCEDHKSWLAEAQSQISTLKSQLIQVEADLQHVQTEFENSQQRSQAQSEEERLKHSMVITQLQMELAAAQDRVVGLERAVQEKEEMLSCHQAGIEALNARCEEQSRALENTHTKSSQHESIIALLRQNSLTCEEELDVIKSQLHRAMALLTPEQRKTVQEGEAVVSPSTSLPALEFQVRHALPMPQTQDDGSAVEIDHAQDHILKNGIVEVLDDDSTEDEADSGPEKPSRLLQEVEDLQRQLEEKEETLHDLQQNNASLLQMLETRSVNQGGDSRLLEVHRLEGEVKALKVEKEQMLAVMNEKSREASSLKAEVMRLMNVVSAQKSALDKLQQDNQALTSRPRQDDSMDDMHREALQNLSRLVRDREVEMEALKQKNETLMAVLQDMNQGGDGGGGGAALTSHFADKENLERQLATLQSEREQMVAFVNQKHSESMAYHAEIQRLNALRAEEGERMENLQAEYNKLGSQFEDRNQSLLKSQNDLINYRQRFADIEVKYGELLQKSSASETVDAASFHTVQQEKERLASRQTELQKTLQERDDKIRTVTEKLIELENTAKSRDSENASLRKQVEHLGFQLQGLGSETEDLRKDRESAEHRMQQRASESHLVKDLNNQLTLSLREKEFEVTSLQERLQKVTALLSEQQGEKTQVTQMLRDQEAAAGKTARLQQEVDQLTLRLKQKQQELSDMQTENLRLKDKEHKLNRELERLRGHLLQIEEGYTREALEAEEREKSLRNRLASAEEQLLTSASQVQSASQHASHQAESLQQQLHAVAGQRDSAYMQVASLQEQCQQYAASLSNLQLVLEQFQREKDLQIAMETERYQQENQRLEEHIKQLEADLRHAQEELEEAMDGLAAASRLSEQLDHKEEALQAMREAVEKRENALRAAEEQIHKLSSSTEAKVEKELMKNLLIGYFHTPARNRKDAIHAIGSVLGFTPDDFLKTDEGEGGSGWVSSLLNRARTSSSPPTTPVRQMRTPEFSQSFSQLFVKFLERESTPPPAPFRLPAEEMAREAQQRHHVKERDPHDKPAFNPFTAPRHVSVPIAVGSAASLTTSSASHLLMGAPGSPTTTFPVFSPFTLSQDSRAGGSGRNTPQTSSTILKDVLGNR